MIAIKFKQGMANTYNLSIFISKLSHKQKSSQIILFKVDKSLRIDFYSTIFIFYLVIYQQIKSGKKSLFDTKEVAEY